jgi:uncharacterized protein (DUF58 family)
MKELLKHVRKIQIRTNRDVKDLLAGSYHSAFKGKGMEFEDVREYHVGDDVRHIDWNVTARMQELYVKNYREERELTVMLLVDVSASCLFSSQVKSKKEILAEIAALLAFSAIENNDKVGLILFSNKIELYLPPKKGMQHGLRVIRELIAFEPKQRLTNFSQLLTFLANVQKRQGICFFLSDFLSSCPKKQFSLVARKHDLINICLSDPKELILPNKGLYRFRDLETNEIRIIDCAHKATREWYEKSIARHFSDLNDLTKKIGASFVSIKSEGSYLESLNKFFKMREKKLC